MMLGAALPTPLIDTISLRDDRLTRQAPSQRATFSAVASERLAAGPLPIYKNLP
jgi:hypothetical protein